MRRFVALVGLTVAVVDRPASTDAAPDKKAGKPTPPACGAKVLPLVEGNSWTYVQVPPPAPIPAGDPLAKIVPRPAKEIVITVKSVQEKKGADTIATLEEKITYEITAADTTKKKPAVTDVIVLSTTITCNKTKFEVSPESFFFSAEPGGHRALAFDKFQRSKDTSFKLTNGTIGDAPWREDIVAHFTRTPAKGSTAKLSGGKLELERVFTPETPEMVITPKGQQFPKAEKLHLVTSGRVTFDEPAKAGAKPQELPANWASKFWFEVDLGVVQTLNMYAHMYQLTEVSLK